MTLTSSRVAIPAGVALEVEDNNSAQEDDTGGVRSLRAQFFILLVQSEHTLLFPEIGTHQEREASVKRSEEIKKKKKEKKFCLAREAELAEMYYSNSHRTQIKGP